MARGGFIIVFNRLPQLIAAVEANSRSAPKRVADKIAASAKARAPVQTGFLRASITTVSVEAGKSAEVQVGASYGAFVEYGTHKMAARPFLYPAVQEHAEEFAAEIAKPLGGKF